MASVIICLTVYKIRFLITAVLLNDLSIIQKAMIVQSLIRESKTLLMPTSVEEVYGQVNMAGVVECLLDF